MSMQSRAGMTYTLESFGDVSETNWKAVQSASETGGAITLFDPNANVEARFYRVKVE